MAVIGLVMILVNATSYIFHLNIISPAIFILGIIFMVIGAINIRKNKKSLKNQ